jgi:hypothetical protein
LASVKSAFVQEAPQLTCTAPDVLQESSTHTPSPEGPVAGVASHTEPSLPVAQPEPSSPSDHPAAAHPLVSVPHSSVPVVEATSTLFAQVADAQYPSLEYPPHPVIE